MPNREIESADEPGHRQSLPRRLFCWNPKPVVVPEIDSDIGELNPLIRAVEVLKYSIQRLEYWLSPNGTLREWMRLNLLVGAIIAFAGILVVPVLVLLLGGIAACVALILQIVTGAIAITVAVITGIIIVRFLMTAKPRH